MPVVFTLLLLALWILGIVTGAGLVFSYYESRAPRRRIRRQVRLDTPITHPEYLEHNYDHHPMPHPEYTRTRSSNMYSNIEEKGN